MPSRPAVGEDPGAKVDPVRGVLDVPVHPRDPGTVEGAARSIVAQRQFRQPGQDRLVQFLGWVGRQLSKLLPSGRVGSLGSRRGWGC